MPHIDVPPLSDLWFKIRWESGNATASNIGKYVGVCIYDTKKVAKDLHMTLDQVIKLKTDILEAWKANRNPIREKGGNIFTRWGQFYEDTAVTVFEKVVGLKVDKSNYWQHPKYSWLYATPDGLIGDDTILEIKNPWKQVHDKPPPEYMAQMQTQMACSERKKAYFMSQCIKTDKAKIWKLNFSTTYYNWLMPQLEHWHNTAVDPCGKLNLDLFDRKPPHVAYELVCEVPSIKEVLGDLPVYDEIFSSEACRWGSEPVFRSKIPQDYKPSKHVKRHGEIPQGDSFDWGDSTTLAGVTDIKRGGIIQDDDAFDWGDGTTTKTVQGRGTKRLHVNATETSKQAKPRLRELLPTEAIF